MNKIKYEQMQGKDRGVSALLNIVVCYGARNKHLGLSQYYSVRCKSFGNLTFR